jgi:hypothetical protein
MGLFNSKKKRKALLGRALRLAWTACPAGPSFALLRQSGWAAPARPGPVGGPPPWRPGVPVLLWHPPGFIDFRPIYRHFSSVDTGFSVSWRGSELPSTHAQELFVDSMFPRVRTGSRYFFYTYLSGGVYKQVEISLSFRCGTNLLVRPRRRRERDLWIRTREEKGTKQYWTVSSVPSLKELVPFI